MTVLTREERALALRRITTDEIFRETLDELERAAFDEFMALPRWRRFAPGRFGGWKARAAIARIDAIRDLRTRLDWLASTQAPAARRVV